MTVLQSDHEHGVSHEHVECGVICVENLSFRYPDGTIALDHIDLHVARGMALALVGPNGAGKTTLLQILLGRLIGYTGSVRIEGIAPDEARRLGVVTWVPQHNRLNVSFPITVYQLVRFGLVAKTGMLRRFPRDDLDYLEYVIRMLQLTEIAQRPIASISGGQLQRALIARALAPRPKLLLLDEPMAGIDAPGQEQFRHILNSARIKCGVTLVMVSHDIRAMLTESQRIACLDRTLHFHDVPAKLTPEILSQVFHYSIDGLPLAHHREEHSSVGER